MIPKIRLAVETMALPVPLSFVGNNSGETAYRTPYITLLVNVYPQFHPSKASDVRAVVLANKNMPVRTVWREWVEVISMNRAFNLRSNLRVEIASVPLRPKYGSSTSQPARTAPGTPITLRITCCSDTLHSMSRLIACEK